MQQIDDSGDGAGAEPNNVQAQDGGLSDEPMALAAAQS